MYIHMSEEIDYVCRVTHMYVCISLPSFNLLAIAQFSHDRFRYLQEGNFGEIVFLY